MKISKNKIIVSTLALAMGAALAGSVSGTVAWFQYSTRAQAAYIGQTAHCSELLKVKDSQGNWVSELDSTKINALIADDTGDDIIPITSGQMTANQALPNTNNVPDFYKNPIYQFPNPETWGKADAHNYVQFNLTFHVEDVDETTGYLAKDLYLVDLTLKATQAGNPATELDLYKAIRVHFSTGTGEGATNKLFAADGSNETTVDTDVYGKLDLNGLDGNDKLPGYEWDGTLEDIYYGTEDGVAPASEIQQIANNASALDTNNKKAVLADDSNPYSIVENSGKLGSIPANVNGLTVTVTIWLEGWTKLGATNSESAIWDAATYINKYFQVGMRFAVEAHDNSVDHPAQQQQNP